MSDAALHDRPTLTDEQCHQFAALALLDRVITEPRAWHAGLVEHPDDHLLEPVFDRLLREDLVTIGADDHYEATERGHAAYALMLRQQQSYLYHFDIFAGVDLAEGVFADPEADEPEDPRWSDLRVAVADYKGIDPHRLVFLSLLADGTFFEGPSWRFDLALGSSFFQELQEIVDTQIAIGELGYEAEDESQVPGDAVIEDVILQGAALNRERLERELGRQPSLLHTGNGGGPEDEDYPDPDDVEEAADVPLPEAARYDPWGPLESYAANPRFVEALWLEPYW